MYNLKTYSEIGIGNPTLISTEFEFPDGTETRHQGFYVKSISEIYFRLWVNKSVLILSSKEGIKIQHKPYRAFKLIIGFC